MPLRHAGQDRRAQQWRHRPGHAGNPVQPDAQHAAEHADLRRPLRPDDAGVRRLRRLCRGHQGRARRARRADELPGPGLVNIKLSQGSARKAQEFRWHS